MGVRSPLVAMSMAVCSVLWTGGGMSDASVHTSISMSGVCVTVPSAHCGGGGGDTSSGCGVPSCTICGVCRRGCCAASCRNDRDGAGGYLGLRLLPPPSTGDRSPDQIPRLTVIHPPTPRFPANTKVLKTYASKHTPEQECSLDKPFGACVNLIKLR